MTFAACFLLTHHTDKKYTPTCMHQPRTHTHRENHRVSPFPASWLASVLHCPSLERDPVSSLRLLHCSHAAENKEMFLPALMLFFFSLSLHSRGKESEEHVIFSFSSEQCAVTEGELSVLDEKSKKSAHRGHTGQSH